MRDRGFPEFITVCLAYPRRKPTAKSVEQLPQTGHNRHFKGVHPYDD